MVTKYGYVGEKSLFLAEKIKFAVDSSLKINNLLSILIPIYNYNGIKLATDLHEQGMGLNVPFEIIVADDHSPSPVLANQGINDLPNGRYEYLPKNLGRSGSRNWLAQKAKYSYLLFIDGDMEVRHEDFLKNYVDGLSAKKVICGGHFYDELEPAPEYLLHWQYGRNREVRPAKERNKAPFEGFVPSNFVISKAVFESIRFDEGIVGYGHEDTLFGEMLQKLDMDGPIEMVHIDNGLVHLGLSTNEEFMDKTDASVSNLVMLSQKYGFQATKLQQTANQLRLFKWLFRLIPSGYLRKRIMATQNLRLLDLYKLIRYYQ